MKTKFITYVALLVISTNVYSQRTAITNDSLRNHFRKETADRVLTSYYQKSFYSAGINFNYKDMYYDTAIKDSLLRWLDEDIIVNQKINEHKQYLLKYFKKEKKKAFTEYYVTHDVKLNFDSIYSNPELYESYYELAIDAAVDSYREDILKRKDELLPEYEVLYLHSKIVYPEAYKIIKQWWYLNNKSEKSPLFRYLLMMNDPEVQYIFDKIVEDAIKNNGESILGINFISNIQQIANAYAVKKLLEILPVTKEILAFSDGTLVPLDSFTFNALLELLEKNAIEGNFIPYGQLTGMSTIKELKYLRDHKESIVEAAHQLIQKLEAEERYWMENMPFDYVPQIVK